MTTLLSGFCLKNLSEVGFFKRRGGEKKLCERERTRERGVKRSIYIYMYREREKSIAVAVGGITVSTGDPSTLIAILTQRMEGGAAGRVLMLDR